MSRGFWGFGAIFRGVGGGGGGSRNDSGRIFVKGERMKMPNRRGSASEGCVCPSG